MNLKGQNVLAKLFFLYTLGKCILLCHYLSKENLFFYNQRLEKLSAICR